MRCLVGLVLFAALYLGSCQVVGEGVAAMTFRSQQRHSQREAQLAGAEAVKKYHALLAVGSGAAAIFACSLPTLLTKISQRDEDWH
jgi:hypothetical protein